MKTTIIAVAALLVGSAAFASLDDMPTKPKPRTIPAPTVTGPSAVKQGEVIEPVPACDYRGLTVSLALDRDFYRSGEIIRPTVTIKCGWEFQTFFNPFLRQYTAVPAEVRMFDDSGKFVEHYVSDVNGFYRKPSAADNVEVPGGGAISTPLELHLIRSTMNGPSDQPLAPGTYRMQVVAFDILITRDAATRDLVKNPPKVIAASPLMPFLVGPKVGEK